MRTQILLIALFFSVYAGKIQGQNNTFIYAQDSEISDNLDLRAVASIFGESNNLEDFEIRLNDPNEQISNLDLNNDNLIDYLRVIESVQNRTHLIIIQSVIGRDIYQDVATIEVEKDNYNNVHLQVVGNSYIYGDNYIYEPVYYRTPLIYASFWGSSYRPYVSAWHWTVYPNFFYRRNPNPVYKYRSNLNVVINTNNRYNYVNNRRSVQAVNLYKTRHSNYYEKSHPDRSFARRNSGATNRYELNRTRNTPNNVRTNQRTSSQRNYSTNRTSTQRTSSTQRTTNQKNYSSNRAETPKASTTQRNSSTNKAVSPGVSTTQRTVTQKNVTSQKASTPQRTETKRAETQNSTNQQRTDSQTKERSSSSNNEDSKNSNRKTE